jgi:hypothetical protein
MMLSMQAARMGSVSNKVGRCTYSTLWARPPPKHPHAPLRPLRTATTTTKVSEEKWRRLGRPISSSGVYPHDLGSTAGKAAAVASSSSMSSPMSSPMSTAPQYYEDNDAALVDEIKTTPPTPRTTTPSSSWTDTTSKSALPSPSSKSPSPPLHRSLVEEPWRVNVGHEDDAWLHGPRASTWFTGMHPSQCPGVDPATEQLRSIPLPHLDSVTRESAQTYFDNSWTLYETLFAGLKGEEGFYCPPVHGLRHPQIFYYGHTACLYVNKLRVSGVLQEPVNPYYESIFEVGVDEMLWDDMHKNDMVRRYVVSSLSL